VSQDEVDIRRAIADVELIRRVLDQVEAKKPATPTVGLFGVTLTANIVLQALALAGALLLTLIELLTRQALTDALVLGGQSPDLRLLGIGLMAAILASLVIVLYFVLWRAARHSGEEFNTYIVRNFRYARLMSYLSDLFLKFAVISLVMLAGQPQWVAPLLLAFTGDYLIQGRLFTLPTQGAVLLGVGCIAAGIIQFLLDSPALLLPLALFSIIGTISIGRLVRLYRQQNGSFR
jgi:hypothetical protein|tara:strand:+ start:286 stop:987 length:702 start_codon:yes stop_codon:yes gene_type:complete